jgi:pimeloyl-ACP methyl ester carboxylesterase
VFQPPSPPPPGVRGRFVDIGGRRLRAVLAGPTAGGAPLVILESGAFGFSADWAAVQDGLTRRDIPSLAYDRAGLGLSDPGPAPRTGTAIAEDLDALLAALGLSGPFILCGHSMAGMHVRIFWSRRRADVVGVVLVDAAPPEAMDSAALRGLVGHFATLSRLAAFVARLGVFRPFAAGAWGDRIGHAGAAGAEKRWAFASARHNHASAEEVEAWRATAAQARDAAAFDPSLPVSVVMPAGANGGVLRGLRSAPAKASRFGAVAEVKGATHATLLNAAYAPVIIAEIERVAEAAPR